ncbi:hypothetical protein TRFO_17861 [Tritrichomonas foetus]|uniref:Uncharacterized protein n=1 Tax=Tritrichomonas foetus TaxID=1144522 RepID=A0A1J4KSC7_9EUKA|nr:hypothetical protein TRFO_17861 [Tritrichomonas foetus]|eukprot:OHT12373.1 hypothetical protein TRFO_17861 [Tritrichomonas foetus]
MFLFVILWLKGMGISKTNDESIKKEYGIFIMDIIKDEIKKSMQELRIQKQLKQIAMDTIDVSSLRRPNEQISEVQKLQKSISDLRKEIRNEQWKEYQARANNMKQIQKDRLKVHISHILPSIKAQNYPFPQYSTLPFFPSTFQNPQQYSQYNRMITNANSNRKRRLPNTIKRYKNKIRK